MNTNIAEFPILSAVEKERVIEALENELINIQCDVAESMPTPPGYRFVQRRMNIRVCQSCRQFRTAYCMKYRRTVRPACVCDEWNRVA